MVSGGTGIAGFTVTDCFRFTESPEYILRGVWDWSGTLSPIYGPHRGRPRISDVGSSTFRRIEGKFRGRGYFKEEIYSLIIKTKESGPEGSDSFVWMTGLEPATSWSLTRCATNCATSRGPFFKGIANIGILFRKSKKVTTYFSGEGVVRAC